MGEKCFIYVVEAGILFDSGNGGFDVFKVGITKNVSSRVATIQTGCPWKVRLAHHLALPSQELARIVERKFHDGNKDARLCGEWFNGWTTGACVEIDELVSELWVNSRGMDGLPDFLSETGMEYVRDHVLAVYGEDIAQ